MSRTGLWTRVFVGLLLAVIPPILLLVSTLLLTRSVLQGVDRNLVAVLVVIGAIVWAAILAVVFNRALETEIRALLALADQRATDEADIGAAQRQLVGALNERDRQVATLVRETAAVRIDDAPARVVGALVTAARSVTGDGTWRAAVLTSDDPTLLAPGVYGGHDDPSDHEPLGDLERWAAVADPDASSLRLDGPWGAFAVVNMAATERLGAILYAPWEGRPEPSPAEAAILSLVGQHFTAAVEHSLLYARVRSQADELDRLARIQSDFLRGVTHDLQTPLTSISALATELRATDRLPDSARSDLEGIAHQADRLRRMVSQLLVTSRLEAGVLSPQSDVFAVRPLIERTWSALRADRPFRLDVDGEPRLAIGDPDRFEQVLWALFDNAVKYSSPGAPIDVGIQPDGTQLAVRITDHGVGMDAETRERAFEQFYRSPSARRMAPDGSGIGLYAASGLVKAMGGSVSVDSEVGRGTTVTIALPSESASAAD